MKSWAGPVCLVTTALLVSCSAHGQEQVPAVGQLPTVAEATAISQKTGRPILAMAGRKT